MFATIKSENQLWNEFNKLYDQPESFERNQRLEQIKEQLSLYDCANDLQEGCY
jgi:hypothetical protein